MAYVSQENKKQKLIALKPILKKYQVKGTLSVNHHLTLVLTITASPIDFIGNYNQTHINKHTNEPFQTQSDYMDVNPYWYHEQFTGEALGFLIEAMAVMMDGNHNRSDIQSDYFDVGWYVDIKIGKYNKHYKIIEEAFCDRNMKGCA